MSRLLRRQIVFGILMSLCVPLAGNAADRTATISFPGSALVFAGDGLDPPDSGGHFAVGIKLPLPNVKAEKCETPYLVAGLGNLNKPDNELSSDDRKTIAHNKEVYKELLSAAKTGKSVTLTFRNKPEYLSVRNGVVQASYCMLSIDDPKGKYSQ